MTVMDMEMAVTDVEVDVDLVVGKRYMASPDIVVLQFHSCDGKPLPQWSPGAHLEVTLGNGISRQYSLCGDPDDRDTWTIAVLRERQSRGGSDYVHDRLHEGTTVTGRGPRNNFPLTEANSYKFVAGGIGITPMLPMILAAERSGKPWTLLYGGRSLDSMAFRDVLTAYSDRVSFHPQDTHGLLDLAGELSSPSSDVGIYCCGPEPLLAAIESHCQSTWPAGALHVERFRSDGPDLEHARPIELELAQSGVTLTVPADRSILDVLTDNGIEVDASCEEGTCGTCETAVLCGQPEHHDVVLTEDERASGETMMVCVSRAKGNCLKLDL